MAVKINPNTTIRAFISAIPSSTALFSRLGISNDAQDERTLRQACNASGVPLETLFEELDNVDWGSEITMTG